MIDAFLIWGASFLLSIRYDVLHTLWRAMSWVGPRGMGQPSLQAFASKSG